MAKVEVFWKSNLAHWQDFHQMPAHDGIKYATSLESGHSSQKIYEEFLKRANLINRSS